MIIASSGKFLIDHQTFLGNKKLTTKRIDLCKKEDGSHLTIARLDD